MSYNPAIVPLAFAFDFVIGYRMTHDTSLSLLQRLKGDRESPDWIRFVSLYDPLLRGWLRRNGLLTDDSDDVVQNVLAVCRSQGE